MPKTRVSAPSFLAMAFLALACAPSAESEPASAAARASYEEGLAMEERRIGVDDWRAAEAHYARAIQEDSTFALAHAGLARVHAAMVHFMYDPTEDRRRLSRAAAARALELEPGLPEGRYAMGVYHYWGTKQYGSAAVELEAALRTLDEPRIVAMAGFVERRRGDFARGLQYLERAGRIDPLAVGADLADTYAAFGRTDEALAAYAVIRSSQPQGHFEINSVLIRLRHHGTTDSLRAALVALPSGFDPDGRATRARLELAWVERRPEDALQAIASYNQPILQDQNTYWPKSFRSGRAHRMAGRQTEARAAFDSARVLLQTAAREHPEEARVHAALAGALAALGQSDEAVREAERALELLPFSRDALNGQAIQLQAAAVYAEVGRHERAIAVLQDLFSRPVYNYALHYLTLDPDWDAIRGLPEFGRIVAGP